MTSDISSCASHSLFILNKISSMTSGECKRLNVSSSSAADEMTDLWSLRVLEDIGGDVLVSQYRKRYASHTS